MVFRNHVVPTVVAASNMSKVVVYTDPGIVYLGSPVAQLVKLAVNYHITFSPHDTFPRSRSEEEVAWGPHEVWQLVFRQHVVPTVVTASNMSKVSSCTALYIVCLD